MVSRSHITVFFLVLKVCFIQCIDSDRINKVSGLSIVPLPSYHALKSIGKLYEYDFSNICDKFHYSREVELLLPQQECFYGVKCRDFRFGCHPINLEYLMDWTEPIKVTSDTAILAHGAYVGNDVIHSSLVSSPSQILAIPVTWNEFSEYTYRDICAVDDLNFVVESIRVNGFDSFPLIFHRRVTVLVAIKKISRGTLNPNLFLKIKYVPPEEEIQMHQYRKEFQQCSQYEKTFDLSRKKILKNAESAIVTFSVSISDVISSLSAKNFKIYLGCKNRFRSFSLKSYQVFTQVMCRATTAKYHGIISALQYEQKRAITESR